MFWITSVAQWLICETSETVVGILCQVRGGGTSYEEKLSIGELHTEIVRTEWHRRMAETSRYLHSTHIKSYRLWVWSLERIEKWHMNRYYFIEIVRVRFLLTHCLYLKSNERAQRTSETSDTNQWVSKNRTRTISMLSSVCFLYRVFFLIQ